jgi:crossover junction endodeoxyribonuclease RuvC
MRIIGIDPGLQISGYGVIDWKPLRPALVDGGVIRLKVKTPIPDRLVELEAELEALFDEYEPELCAVEQLYSNYEHPRTAILMGHARGVILLIARRRGVEVQEFAANRIKQSLTGMATRARTDAAGIQHPWNRSKRPDPPTSPMRWRCSVNEGRWMWNPWREEESRFVASLSRCSLIFLWPARRSAEHCLYRRRRQRTLPVPVIRFETPISTDRERRAYFNNIRDAVALPFALARRFDGEVQPRQRRINNTAPWGDLA